MMIKISSNVRAATLVLAICASLFCFEAQGGTITTADGAGEDFSIRSNNAARRNDAALVVKNIDGTDLDRVTFLQFDLTGIDTKLNGELSISTRASGANQLFAGETLTLYGIPDLSANEDVLAASWTWDDSPFIDATEENVAGEDNVDASAATLLQSVTLGADTTGGSTLTFNSAAVNSFVAADTNNVLSFIVSLVQPTSTGNTPAFESDDAVAPGVAPTLTTVVPEPATASLLALGGIFLFGKRRLA